MNVSNLLVILLLLLKKNTYIVVRDVMQRSSNFRQQGGCVQNIETKQKKNEKTTFQTKTNTNTNTKREDEISNKTQT
jgi:Sec-independent protein translocase protein TatA